MGFMRLTSLGVCDVCNDGCEGAYDVCTSAGISCCFVYDRGMYVRWRV